MSLSWDQLLSEIDRILSDNRADIDEVKSVLASYKSNRKDWEKFALFDPHCYTRNLVTQGNGRYNVMLLCWNVGQASAIHSHAGAHCFMKMLDGSLVEELFDTPDNIDEGAPLVINRKSRAETNDIIYINDSIGTHRVVNPSHARTAISMHIYSPPYEECQCYDERTGKSRNSGAITFYSKQGTICEDEFERNMGACDDYC